MKPAVLLLGLMILAGCGSDRTETLQILALGTVIDISVHAPPAGWRTELRSEIEPWLESFGREMYAYGNGELARANAAWRKGECARVSDQLGALLDSARALEVRHGDRFSPAIADLITLWRLHETDADDWAPPPLADIEAHLVSPPAMRDLTYENGAWCTDTPLAVDTGGFAKGMALDYVTDALLRRGWSSAMVNVGGDLSAVGRRGGRDWRVAIKHPTRAGALASFAAGDGEHVMTSGDYERGFTHQGVRYTHILDPASGRPVEGVSSVTVVGQQAMHTDAAATALFVAAGRALRDGHWPALPDVPDAALFVVVAADGSAAVSASLAPRLTWHVENPRWHVLP